MINIYLNDLNYRYDVYLMFNIFFPKEEIKFIEDQSFYNVYIFPKYLELYYDGVKKKYVYDNINKVKDDIKKGIYIFLKEITKKSPPWGTLVGIRPTKIALSMLDLNYTEEKIAEFYKKTYLTDEDKINLCIEVAKLEKKLVNKDKRSVSIYIGMPFCPTRCLYCSFTSNPINSCKAIVEPYLKALTYEISKTSKYIKDKGLNIESVYFGGGTPTSVDDIQFNNIMNVIFSNFINEFKVKEFTVECGRPDSISYKKLETMKAFKVNRISINPQSMNDATLKLIGRFHREEDIIEKFNMARELGFDNINMDIIVGLPGEGLEHVKNTCSKIYRLAPDNVTVHGMSVKRGSRLHENIILNKDYKEPDYDETLQMFKSTYDLAKDLNMKPYYMYRQKNMVGNMENIGYCKDGKEGLYNIEMIEENQSIIACGADAVSKIVFMDENRIERFANVKDVREYINRVEEMIIKKNQLLDQCF